jgi:hypothetical protein
MAVVMLATSVSFGQEFIDGNPPSQAFGMHSCPAGTAMGGAQVAKNEFLCRKTDEPEQDCFVDYSTQRQGMHACPAGSYMRGFQNSRNELLCCFDRRAGTSHLVEEMVDSGTQDYGMHVCTGHQANTAMVGIQEAKNRFLCAQKQPRFPASSFPVQPQDPSLPRNFLNAATATPSQRAAWQFATWNWLAHILRLNAVKGYTPPAIGGPPSAAPPAPNYSVVRQEPVEDTRQFTIQYPSPIDGAPETAYLVLPPNYDPKRQYPAVIVTHGHDDNCKDSLARNWNDPDHAAALYMAKQGAIALAPDTRSFCSYRTALQRASTTVLDHYGLTAALPLGTLPSEFLIDNMVRVSLLSARSDIDRKRIFTAGLSLGSFQAMWTAAMDDRVAGVVAGDLFLDLRCLDSGGSDIPRHGHACQTIPSLSRDYEAHPKVHDLTISQESVLIDTADIAALIAPRPLLVVWGEKDPFYTKLPDCVSKAMREARLVYRAYDVPDNLSIQLIPGMQHEFEDFTSAQFLLGSASARRAYGAQWSGTCPDGFGMIGVHLSTNEFLCARASSSDISCQVDPQPGGNPRKRADMHACPDGFYIQGVEVNKQGAESKASRFTCCKIADSSSTGEAVDSATQLEGMHACPQQPAAAPLFMTGLQVVVTGSLVVKDWLLCER